MIGFSEASGEMQTFEMDEKKSVKKEKNIEKDE
jgi:hypothetical protein